MAAMKAAWDFFQNQILGMSWLYTGIGICASGIIIVGYFFNAIQYLLI